LPTFALRRDLSDHVPETQFADQSPNTAFPVEAMLLLLGTSYGGNLIPEVGDALAAAE